MKLVIGHCALVIAAALFTQPAAAADLFVAQNFNPSPTADGSKQKPFHDPYLAFRAANAGDTIHIAAGTYYGRFDRASWLIDRPNLTVLGGYNADFSSRNPW